ncbi:cupin [Bacillus sp. M6-12]|uniref:cupin domain-containing protein n=1 Tax=Bacillus sp. M6-12 TaxID=2054166 RepID=UPI000C75A777|nr:cupin domain-containing protein [Bacillus sp. M6-12]PLS18537.1 cupin [Bacillus sp. M6-12]
MAQNLKEFYEDVVQHNFCPLWEAGPTTISKEPVTKVVPYLWKWELIKEKLTEAGKLIKPGEKGSDRRVLMLQNPGLADIGWRGSTTQTLTTAIQMIMPGEKAPSHRHSQTALRFIIEGEGAYTVVNGEKVAMDEGDFLLTSSWCWHEHGHDGAEPMFWLDTLDIPFVNAVNAGFFEADERTYQPVEFPENYSIRKYANGMVRPIQDHNAEQKYRSPLANYKWDKTQDALDSLSDFNPNSYDGVCIEYINPNNGGSANEHIGTWMQKLPVGFHSKAHRHVHSTVYHVFRGSGYSIINGTKFEWSKGDVFVVPTWAWHEHVNTSEEPSYLFSINDLPIMELLGFEKEQEHPKGNQEIKDVFQPNILVKSKE